MQIVKFKNGKYAVRKRSFLLFGTYVYLDLETKHHWWTKDRNCFPDCLGTREECESSLEHVADYGTPV